MEGVMSESHFSKLFNLNHLDLSSNPHLVLNIHSDWIPPFQLEYIHLRSCKLGPSFPKWFQTQNKSVKLDISNSGISDFVPNWFWNLSTHLLHMNLSNNQMGGTIGNYPLEGFDSLLSIDLSMNQFEGPVPLFSNKVVTSYLSNNKFSSLNSLCDATEDTLLSFLDVSYNQLAGELPDCWSHFTRLEILLLTNNKLSGKIPSSVGSLSRIQMFHLGNNNLIGQFPSSLNKCRELTVLDVGENRLEGPIPTWIGESLPYLSVLSLRSNRFNGSMPSSLCYLVYIQLLDLSSNDIDGSIPNCFNNFIARKKKASIERIGNGTVDSAINDTSITLSYNGSINGYDAQVALIWKGKLSYYKSTLRLVKSIDLSSNKLAGEIPTGFTELIGLVSLNLSRNNLSGQIPETIGQLKSSDALDLSRNHLSGKIPSSLSEVDRLNFLDLSSNNLSGKIPTSTQLQSFDSSTYMGNFELCGPPLTKNCPEEESTTSTET
ncbi:LRR domain containing protein [Parasponia andersonii]|uniref:LRR domain containing protein n=1 Tax=Parasponia andersonii TaxID=3476 RepID=A0A2P5AZX5_PARAD|nr:LRR domain containing protein [Parasponia andersonii]